MPAYAMRRLNDSVLASAAVLIFRKEGAMTLAASSLQLRSCLNVMAAWWAPEKPERNKSGWGGLLSSIMPVLGSSLKYVRCPFLGKQGGVYKAYTEGGVCVTFLSHH